MPALRHLVRLVQRVHFVVACFLGGLFFLVCSGGGVVESFVRPRRPPGVHPWSWLWGRFMGALLGWRYEVENEERLHVEGPRVYVSNHQSNLDAAPLGALIPDRCVAIAKKELTKIPIFGGFVVKTGNVVIDRGNRESAVASLNDAVRRIRDERLSLWVFPEGHRSQREEMLPFKKGAFHLAIAAQIPIYPIVFSPLDRLLDASRWVVRPGAVRVRCLPPIETTGLKEEDVDALLEKTRAAMDEARRDLFATAGPRI